MEDIEEDETTWEPVFDRSMLCPQWFACRSRGVICYHDHKHYGRVSCSMPEHKVGWTSGRKDSDACYHPKCIEVDGEPDLAMQPLDRLINRVHVGEDE